MSSSSFEQLQEYQSQLVDIEELLQDDPTDESLLKLKSDLLELIALSQEDAAAATATTTTISNDILTSTTEAKQSLSSATILNEFEQTDHGDVKDDEDQLDQSTQQLPKKKLKKLKDFEIPSHLQILDTDSEKEKTRKKRAVKLLKSKHREKQREYETTKKQQSWQNFHKKSGKKRTSQPTSIFATQDGILSKVGVVSMGTGMTELHERKRHKF